MKKTVRTIFVATLLATASLTPTKAGIPVIDTASITQLIAQLNNQAQSLVNQATQIQNQINQITELQNQLANMEQRLTAMTGIKNISSILNNADEQLKREAAGTIDSILSSVTSGTPLSGGNSTRLNTAIEAMKSRFEISNLTALNSSTQPRERGIAQVASVGIAAAATGEDSYERSNEGMTRVGNLIGQIDTQPDLKASVDLNTRMVAEVAQQMNEMLRVLAVQAQAQGTLAVDQARDRAAATTFQKVGN